MEDGPTMPNIAVMEETLQTQTTEISQYAASVIVSVNNDSEYEAAMVEIINVRERRKKQEKFFKDLIDPLVAVVADMRLKIATALEPIRTKESTLNSCITAYAEKKQAEADEAKRQAELAQAQALTDAMVSNEPVLVDVTPAPLHLPTQPASVKTGTHTGGVVDIPKWKFEKHPEINSDEDSDIYADDKRAKGVDLRLFILDRGRVTTWNKSKVPMKGVTHFYGKGIAVNKRKK